MLLAAPFCAACLLAATGPAAHAQFGVSEFGNVTAITGAGTAGYGGFVAQSHDANYEPGALLVTSSLTAATGAQPVGSATADENGIAMPGTLGAEADGSVITVPTAYTDNDSQSNVTVKFYDTVTISPGTSGLTNGNAISVNASLFVADIVSAGPVPGCYSYVRASSVFSQLGGPNVELDYSDYSTSGPTLFPSTMLSEEVGVPFTVSGSLTAIANVQVGPVQGSGSAIANAFDTANTYLSSSIPGLSFMGASGHNYSAVPEGTSWVGLALSSVLGMRTLIRRKRR